MNKRNWYEETFNKFNSKMNHYLAAWFYKNQGGFPSSMVIDKYVIYSDFKKIISITNIKTGKVGIAKKDPNDTFNYIIGTVLALVRCGDVEMPIFSKPLKNCQEGEIISICHEKENNKYIVLGKIRNFSDIAVKNMDDSLIDFFFSDTMVTEI